MFIFFTEVVYAWFTMSRKVEVQNIQMTAAVSEDVQIKTNRSSDTGIYAVSGLGTSDAGVWSTILQNNASGTNAVVTLNVGTGSTYGNSKKVIIRV